MPGKMASSLVSAQPAGSGFFFLTFSSVAIITVPLPHTSLTDQGWKHL
jgi:hypothetical protein